MTTSSAAPYICAAGVTWVVEARGILIVHPTRGACCTLLYPAAAVWDLLTCGYSIAKMTRMIRHIGGFPGAADAAGCLSRCFKTWEQEGFISPVNGGTDV